MATRNSFNWTMCSIVMAIAAIIGTFLQALKILQDNTYWGICMIFWACFALISIGGQSDAK
jgi:cyanate permease